MPVTWGPPRFETVLEKHPDILVEGSESNFLIRRWLQKNCKYKLGQHLHQRLARKAAHFLNNQLCASERMYVTQAVRAGVPASVRGEFWYVCSGASLLQIGATAGCSYADISKQPIPDDVMKSIEKDMHRTTSLKDIGEGEAMQSLRRILVAFAVRNPLIGYCQSMNFIGCLLLLHLEEEKAFWVLCAVIENVLPNDFYATSLLGVRIEVGVLAMVVEHKLPNLWRHFQSIDVDFQSLCYSWFLCLFVTTIPLEMTLRIWDVLFNEGPKILIRIAVALLSQREPDLLQAEHIGDVFMCLKHPVGGSGALDEPTGATDISPDRLIRKAFDKLVFGSFSMHSLDAFREQVRQTIEQEAAEVEARRQTFESKKQQSSSDSKEPMSSDTPLDTVICDESKIAGGAGVESGRDARRASVTSFVAAPGMLDERIGNYELRMDLVDFIAPPDQRRDSFLKVHGQASLNFPADGIGSDDETESHSNPSSPSGKHLGSVEDKKDKQCCIS